MPSAIERRLAKIEQRFRSRLRGVHRYSDDELDALISWLRDPDPSRERWAANLLQREGLIR
ncbi:hypothetical protein [Methylorubrum extorquens]|uniref:Uncharacterized protein n=1 Tax=Methylorubrum extorquens (strain CM4 / NCIMB 13688) TaxID=440085 RepID=B7L3S0_METC4|nr:hypothetical protein [Methylorubrum extorquens]ACK86478.1 hypothetical protein Mchl_5767 [Methylorubrum extorquens CM4]